MSKAIIGVIGFGVVGKSVVEFILRTEQIINFFSNKSFTLYTELEIVVWDSKSMPTAVQEYWGFKNTTFSCEAREPLADFLARIDFVIPSPGVDLSLYTKSFGYKFIEELDLFAFFLNKPSVAITGTLGKTSVTKLVGKLLSNSNAVSLKKILPNKPTIGIGGNIGMAMLDLIDSANCIDAAVLELSSFQLERIVSYAPHIAVITNLYDNHLDRHGTMVAYAKAKAAIFMHQKLDDILIVHEQCFTFSELSVLIAKAQSRIIIVGSAETLQKLPIFFKPIEIIYLEHTSIVLCTVNRELKKENPIFLAKYIVSQLPNITFLDNWLMAIAVLYALDRDISNILESVIGNQDFYLEDHHYRLEHFLTTRGIDFYDDSKSTVVQATIAAVNKIAQQKRPIILILGGMSKGVDRSSLMGVLGSIEELKQVYCFGSECASFPQAKSFFQLQEVLQDIMTIASAGDIILFSPSGASFDFFSNYKHRGDVFKELAKQLFKE